MLLRQQLSSFLNITVLGTSKFYGHRHDFLLDDTEYLCHKWQRIYSVCRNNNRVLSWLIIGNATRVPRSVPLEEEELLTFPVHLSSSLVLSGIRVTQFLLLCVMFCRTLFLILSWFFLSFGYCIVYPLSIYGFWLPIFKLLQTFLTLHSHFYFKRIQQQNILLIQLHFSIIILIILSRSRT